MPSTWAGRKWRWKAMTTSLVEVSKRPVDFEAVAVVDQHPFCSSLTLSPASPSANTLSLGLAGSTHKPDLRTAPAALQGNFSPGSCLRLGATSECATIFSGRMTWRVRIAAAEQGHGGDLPPRKIRIAEIMPGIDDLDADRARVDVGVAAPDRYAGMPGAIGLLHELNDRAVLHHEIMRRHPRFRCRTAAAARHARSACRCSAARSCPAAPSPAARRNWVSVRRRSTTLESGRNCDMSPR